MARVHHEMTNGALAYAQSVREWADTNGHIDAAAAVASATARFAAREAYGAQLDWQWGGIQASVPVLDPELAAMLFCPSSRTRSEAGFYRNIDEAGVIDLVGDALTLLIALANKHPVALMGEGKALRLWHELLAIAAPQSDAKLIDVMAPPERPPFRVNWVRCLKLSHWLDLAGNLPPAWSSFAPVITCDADESVSPPGWDEMLLDPEGRSGGEPARGVLRVLWPPRQL